MTAPLAGRTAVVTGGASGIGLAAVRALRAEGVRVLAVDLEQCTEADAFVRADVSQTAGWARVATEVERQFGALDLAFLNAGIASQDGELTSIDEGAIINLVAVDLLGVILGVRALLPLLRRSSRGSIIATASLAGVIAYPPDPVYAAAKHGVVGFVRALAPRLAGEGITVHAICPGLTDTALLPAAGREAITRDGYPLLSASDVAAVVLELFVDSGTGRVAVCQPGRPAVDYLFRNVPGPASGQAPPAIMSQDGWGSA